MISVLYIDDSPGLIREVKQFLERSGDFSVDAEGSGTNALTHFPFSGYDIIISAYELIGMNGTEIIRKFREYDPVIPFILIANTPVTNLRDDGVLYDSDYIIQRQGSLFQFYEDLSLKIKRSVKRSQRERKIRERNLKLNNLANPFRDGNWVITGEGTILQGESEIAVQLAISIEDLRINGLFPHMKEEERCRLLLTFDTLKEKKVKNFEFELIGLDMSVRSFMCEEVRLHHQDSGGEMFVFYGLSEINRLKKANQILQKIDLICDMLLSSIDGVLWIIDTVSMTYTFISSSCSRFLVHNAEDLIGGEISRGDIIVATRPVSDIVWERAVFHLSSDNSSGLYSDRLSHYYGNNGSAFMTDVTSEYFLNEERDVIMVRGYTKKIPNQIITGSDYDTSDFDRPIQEKIGIFLDTIHEKITELKSVSEQTDVSNQLEKTHLLKFAFHHHCTWQWYTVEKIDQELSELQTLCDKF